MARLERVTHKLFAENAPVVESGNTSVEIGQFGSALAGTYVATNDVATLQALPAYTRGWGGAIIADEQLPTLEDMNAVQRVQSYQTGYLFQEGIAEYDANSEYGIGSICKVVDGTDVKLYKSLIADNVGNPITDTNSWEELSFSGGGLEIGDIGIAPLGIDESLGKRRYLNGSILVQEQYPYFTQRVKTAVQTYAGLGCTEEEWQTISNMSVGGQCGKFVVDDTAGTIRLPKIIMPIQGLTNLTNLGEIVSAGLPNIIGSLSTGALGQSPWATSGGTGALYSVSSGGAFGWGAQGLNSTIGVGIDASRSNSIYGNSTTVQQEQIQYPYFIQVATGSSYQENITNEIELNNPFVLLEGKYFETPVYNVSWLQSNASFTGSLALHPSAYNALLIEQNPNVEVGTTVDNYTKRGLSVKLSTEAYTDYDFVLNTTSQTFRCPTKLKTMDRYLVDTKQATDGDPTWYNLYSDGWCEQGGRYSIATDGQGSVAFLRTFINTDYGFFFTKESTDASTWSIMVKIGTKTTTSIGIQSNLTGYSINGSWQACGYVSETVSEDLTDKLYFYVGETVQNANLVNVGRVEEKLGDCITRNDCKAYITETSPKELLPSWYRVYSDGWCEQGGYSTSGGDGKSVTFLLPFVDTNYSVNITKSVLTNVGSTAYGTDFETPNKQVGGMIVNAFGGNGFSWEVKGYIR